LSYNIERTLSHVNHTRTDKKRYTHVPTEESTDAPCIPTATCLTFQTPSNPAQSRLASGPDVTFDPITLHVIDDDRIKALRISSDKMLVQVISSFLLTSHIEFVSSDINPIKKNSSEGKIALYCAMCAAVLAGIPYCI